MNRNSLTLIFLLWIPSFSVAQPTIARVWNEALLEAIRNDYARPVVHARNLFHVSAAMYDVWAVYTPSSRPYFLGNTQGGYYFPFTGIDIPEDIEAARHEAISYASYQLIRHRFSFSPGWEETLLSIGHLMDSLGYDPTFTSEDYTNGSPAALGNYLAARIIDYGFQDGSNEDRDYYSPNYVSVNEPLLLTEPGIGYIANPNRWQPLAFATFIDQSGNEIVGNIPQFIGPEWGKVVPFSLKLQDRTVYERANTEYWVYHDPGDPCYLDPYNGKEATDYKWNFSLVANWSSHLDPTDGVLWDISPASIGNLDIESFPTAIPNLREFYNRKEGGDFSPGYRMNPITNEPYEPQIVSRGDYSRVLAEFWADGPDSETPPGHWFTILNYVNDHPLLEKRLQGEGELLSELEWDVKSYFLLGGAMHDAAIAAWSIKGYYDYIRPISAIRYLANQGQSTDENLPNYSPNGIPLEEGYVELISENDPLAGSAAENVGKVKVFAWRGHDFIQDTTDVAGTGWILAENWWPYQRPTFVTPPFAGYVSGHSTFSRAAAEVLTLLTGSEYFPGGIGEFVAKKNEFLVFEEGPSTDVVLQWAKYYDASDQCSLSRIWGGIHPPVDDIPGRLIGQKVGQDAFRYARNYFENKVLSTEETTITDSNMLAYPNPLQLGTPLQIRIPSHIQLRSISIRSVTGELIYKQESGTLNNILQVSTNSLKAGAYVITFLGNNTSVSQLLIIR